jgi:hypothetical protein
MKKVELQNDEKKKSCQFKFGKDIMKNLKSSSSED